MQKKDVEDFPMQHCQISICKGRDQRIDEFFHKNYSFSWLKAPLLKISRGCNRQSHETSQLSIPPGFSTTSSALAQIPSADIVPVSSSASPSQLAFVSYPLASSWLSQMLLERIDGKIPKRDISLNNYQTRETGDKNQEGTPD